MLDVQFGVGFSENIGQTLVDKKLKKVRQSEMTEFEKWQEKRADRKRKKKAIAKTDKEQKKI